MCNSCDHMLSSTGYMVVRSFHDHINNKKFSFSQIKQKWKNKAKGTKVKNV